MTTSVPPLIFTTLGFVAPAESAILAGVQADQNAAFGGNLNPALTNPTGQYAQSLTAMLGDNYDQQVALFNSVDPSLASGRMQDAIGRIYYLSRLPAESTVVSANCYGLTGTVIPVNAQAVDQSGNIYLCTGAGTIPAAGFVTLSFACAATGPIACPPGFLNRIYQAIPGWDSINNLLPGVVGTNVESRSAFETRRQQSVAINSQGSLDSILGAVLAVPGVLDAYVTENPSNVQSGSLFTGQIVSNVLNITSSTTGTVRVGHVVMASDVIPGTQITGFLTGAGGVGTYTVNISQSTALEQMTAGFGGQILLPNSIYVAAYGGSATAIAQAIWTKKSPGCNYNGNTTVIVTDAGPASNPYTPPLPTYPVTFEIPTPIQIAFSIQMQANVGVPSNAMALVQAAVTQSFNGLDGGQRARIGSTIFASRYFANIAALGSWAQIYSIQVGIGSGSASPTNPLTSNSIVVPINQVPTITNNNILVTFS